MAKKRKSKPNRYVAKPGSRVSKKAANEIGLAMDAERIDSAQALLKLATPKRSRLHKYFLWDDTEAAHRYRLWQARNYVCSIIRFDIQQNTFVKERHSIVIKPQDHRYEKHRVILKNEEYLESLSSTAYCEILSILNRVERLGLAETNAVWALLSRLIRANDPRAKPEEESAVG